MKYRFTITGSTESPTKASVEFRARTEQRAFTFVIRHIINAPGNEPLRAGTLEKLDAFGWERVMCWKRGPGWYFDPPRDTGMVDLRKAPGS